MAQPQAQQKPRYTQEELKRIIKQQTDRRNG